MARSKKSRGQASLEYVLVLALVGVFGMFVTKYFIRVFSTGLNALSLNVGVRLDTGSRF
jgi:uncharacterized protein (UPF0333 family)